MGEKKQEITRSSQQACFGISYSSGDVLYTRRTYKHINLLYTRCTSPDEWEITKQACRDECLVSCFFSGYVCMYVCKYLPLDIWIYEIK